MRPIAILSIAPWLPGRGRSHRVADARASDPATAAIWRAVRLAIAGVAAGRRNQGTDLDLHPLALFAVPNPPWIARHRLWKPVRQGSN